MSRRDRGLKPSTKRAGPESGASIDLEDQVTIVQTTAWQLRLTHLKTGLSVSAVAAFLVLISPPTASFWMLPGFVLSVLFLSLPLWVRGPLHLTAGKDGISGRFLPSIFYIACPREFDFSWTEVDSVQLDPDDPATQITHPRIRIVTEDGTSLAVNGYLLFTDSWKVLSAINAQRALATPAMKLLEEAQAYQDSYYERELASIKERLEEARKRDDQEHQD